MQVISHGDEQHSLQVVLTVPSIIFSESALQAVFSDEIERETAKAWLASKELDILSQEVAASSSVHLHLNGQAHKLQANLDFYLPDAFDKLRARQA